MDRLQSDKYVGKAEKGFVTLLFVLIVFAVSAAISSSLLLSGLASSEDSFALNQSDQAKTLADACAEKGLETIRENNGYTGTTNLSLGAGTCSYTVSNTGGSTRTVAAAGTVGSVTRKAKVLVDQLSPQIHISSWQEVADL